MPVTLWVKYLNVLVMKVLTLVFIFSIFMAPAVNAQIKIGDNPQNIDAASVLELESTERVLVITKVNTAQMEPLSHRPGVLSTIRTPLACIIIPVKNG